MRSVIRTSLSWVLFGLILTILIAVVGEWFIEVAKDKGLYENAGTRWDAIMSALSGFILSPWLLYPCAVLAGLVAGLWLDALLRKKGKGRSLPLLSYNDPN